MGGGGSSSVCVGGGVERGRGWGSRLREEAARLRLSWRGALSCRVVGARGGALGAGHRCGGGGLRRGEGCAGACMKRLRAVRARTARVGRTAQAGGGAVRRAGGVQG